MDNNQIPEYNRINYEKDDLAVQKAKQEAIDKQKEENKKENNK